MEKLANWDVPEVSKWQFKQLLSGQRRLLTLFSCQCLNAVVDHWTHCCGTVLIITGCLSFIEQLTLFR